MNLDNIFKIQDAQQKELGLDPMHMDEHERMDRARRVLLGINEETAALSKMITTYKRHLLAIPDTTNRENIADKVADHLKYLVIVCQMYGLSPEDLYAGFKRKTSVTSAKARYDRLNLRPEDKVIGVDLDDVIADLSEWTAQLNNIKSTLPNGEASLRTMEDFKDKFYRGGGFRECEVIPGALPTLTRLSNNGWKIVIMTARPAEQYKRLFFDTLMWLQEKRIPHDKLVFSKDKTEVVHSLAPAWPRAVVEDHPKNALSLAASGVRVLLYDQPHNYAINNETPNIHRVRSWNEVWDHLTAESSDDESQDDYAASMRGQRQ